MSVSTRAVHASRTIAMIEILRIQGGMQHQQDNMEGNGKTYIIIVIILRGNPAVLTYSATFKFGWKKQGFEVMSYGSLGLTGEILCLQAKKVNM